MKKQNQAKPATVRICEPVSEIEQLGGRLYSLDSAALANRQAEALTRRCAISAALAAVVAPLVFGES